MSKHLDATCHPDQVDFYYARTSAHNDDDGAAARTWYLYRLYSQYWVIHDEVLPLLPSLRLSARDLAPREIQPYIA